MKRVFALIAVLAISLTLAACNNPRIEIAQDNVTRIKISDPHNFMPRTYTSPESIAVITDHLTGLSLIDNFPENPDEYSGWGFNITIYFDDGTTQEFFHFGNQFLRKTQANGSFKWYRLLYEQANQLENIIQRTPSDE